jgi:hypothetical protein
MRQLLLLALALFSLVWWVWRALTSSSARPQPGASAKTPRTDGEMVRDRVCNTFLPRERALTTRLGSEQLFFCSERCRDTFLAGARQTEESG